MKIAFGNWEFKTKKALRSAVKAVVDPHIETPMIEFYDQLVADLFAARHYALPKYGVRPVGFRWDSHPRYFGDNRFNIRIADARFPNLDWRPASWNKAIDGWTICDDTLDAALREEYRDAIYPIINAYRMDHPACEKCGTMNGRLEVHHFEPSFKAITDRATALLTSDERATLIANYDWFDARPWRVPDKCLRAVEAEHATTRLMVVCQMHHYEFKRTS